MRNTAIPYHIKKIIKHDLRIEVHQSKMPRSSGRMYSSTKKIQYFEMIKMNVVCLVDPDV